MIKISIIPLLVLSNCFTKELDSLLRPVCDNPKQIYVKMVGNKKTYSIAEKEYKTIELKRILKENNYSYPYIKKHDTLFGVGICIVLIGGGLLIADAQKGNIGISPIEIGGYALMGIGLGIGMSRGGQFKMAIRAYNGSICKNQFEMNN